MRLKTKRAAAKRFKITGSGKISRRHSHHSHILTKKNRKRKRNLKDWAGLAPSDKKRVRKMLHI